MIRIDPSTLYTRQDLAYLLDGSGVDVDFFIRRIQARKVFRFLWLGSDILEGLRTAPALQENKKLEMPAAQNQGNRKRRYQDKEQSLDPLQQIINGHKR